MNKSSRLTAFMNYFCLAAELDSIVHIPIITEINLTKVNHHYRIKKGKTSE